MRDPTPVTSAPVATAMKASSPVPQPTSSHRSPGPPCTPSTIARCMSASVPRSARTAPSPTSRRVVPSVPRRPFTAPFVVPSLLARLAEVQVPEQPRRARAVRPPRLADRARAPPASVARRARALGVPPPAARCRRPATCRAGGAQRGGRPRPSTARCRASATSAEPYPSSSSAPTACEVERAVLDRRRERTDVARLLAAEPVGAQLLVASRRGSPRS